MGVFIFGLIIGVAAKAFDSTSLFGDIGTDLTIWILLGTLIAAFSRHPISAGIDVLLFFLALLAGYYLYCQLILGFFPASYFFGWLIVALASLPCGVIVWFSKSDDWLAAVITAIPASVIFAWSYPAFYIYNVVLLLGLVYGLLLCALLPQSRKMKFSALGLSIVFAFIIVGLNLLSILPF